MGGGGGSGGGGGGGVEDLPPIIKRSGDQDAHISEFKGRAVGVDVSVWLHKGLGLVEAARQTAGDVSESGAEDEEDGEEAGLIHVTFQPMKMFTFFFRPLDWPESRREKAKWF